MAVFSYGTQTIESNLAAEETVEILRKIGSNFTVSLVNWYESGRRWTPNQTYYAVKLAEDFRKEQVEETKPAVYNFPGIWEFLNRATKLKQPCIKFRVSDGEIVIKKHYTLERFTIKFNGKQIGYIGVSGRVTMYQVVMSVMATLDELEERPESFCSAYGKKSGHCCFCSLPLTDERSLTAGYGPICAGHYNLPWGN